MPSLTSLDAAAQERKARLAKLKNLKRKQPHADSSNDADADTDEKPLKYPKSPSPNPDTPKGEENEDVTTTYLSGRNYDPSTRGPKLGFEVEPAADQQTLEADAQVLAEETKKKAEENAKEDKPLDLFTLQPKKPNWDLKRDLGKRLEILNVRTENAIAKLVRERVEEMKKRKGSEVGQKDSVGRSNGKEEDSGDENEEAIGMDGVALVEAMHIREREDEDDRKASDRDDEMDDET